MNKILLFIPCYNCENEIVKVLKSLKNNFYQYFKEILVVDNGSKDGTLINAIDYAKQNKELPLTILQNRENYNLGGSHKVAFKYAIEQGFDYLVVLHGDNQGEISDVQKILDEKIYTEYDCCLGARFMKGSKLINYSAFRIFGNICFNILFSICLFKPLYDLGGGLNIYSINMLKNNFWERFPDALTFNYLMTMAADFYKHKYLFFPLTWKEDGQVSNVKVTSQAFDLLKKLFQYLLNREKFIKSEHRFCIIENYESNLVYTNIIK